MKKHHYHRDLSPMGNPWLILSVYLFFCQGCLSQISVIQEPSAVVSEVEKNVTLNCLFTHTPDQKVTGPILYWYYENNEFLHPHPTPQYKDRVIVLNPDKNSSNRSILLLHVRWEDKRKYHCMLSYEKSGESTRTRGKGVTLFLHGPMMFDVSSGSQNKLLCSVEVFPNDGFHLTVLCNGLEVAQGQSHVRGSFEVLSAEVSEAMTCECQLILNSTVILTQSYVRKSKVSEGPSEVLPEPIILYIVILLIPICITLIIVVVDFISKKGNTSKWGRKAWSG